MNLTLKDYFKELEKRFQAHYDVETNKTIAGKQLDIYAISIIEHFRHIFTKKIQIDHYQEREIILVKGLDEFIDKEKIDEFLKFLIDANQELVTPSFKIMSHIINGIFISSQGFSKEVIESARRFKYGKTYCLGIKGWCDIRLLLIDINKNCVFCNAKGREVAEVYSFERHKGGDKQHSIKQ